jgi:hypothetical protein
MLLVPCKGLTIKVQVGIAQAEKFSSGHDFPMCLSPSCSAPFRCGEVTTRAADFSSAFDSDFASSLRAAQAFACASAWHDRPADHQCLLAHVVSTIARMLCLEMNVLEMAMIRGWSAVRALTSVLSLVPRSACPTVESLVRAEMSAAMNARTRKG